MKRLFLLLFAALALSPASFAATYPTKGIIARFTFDYDGRSTVGNSFLTDVSPYEEAKWREAKSSDLKRYVKGGNLVCHYENPSSGLGLKPKGLISSSEKITYVARFKLSPKHRQLYLFQDGASRYMCAISKDCKIYYDCAKDKKADKRYNINYVIDLGFKPNEWTTFVATIDATTGDMSFAANGFIQTMNNPAITTEFKDISKTINQHLRFSYDRKSNEEVDPADKNFESLIDEIIFYNRILTTSEITAIAGVGGELKTLEPTFEEPEYQVTWWLVAFQLVSALFIFWLLFMSRCSKLKHIDAERMRKAMKGNRSEQEAEQLAIPLLHSMFRNWNYHVDIESVDDLPTEMSELCFPDKRKYLNKSYRDYKKILATGTTNPQIIESLNMFIDIYNNATEFIFAGKWWMFSLPVLSVYVREMINNFMIGIGLNIIRTEYASLPEGTIDQFLYFTEYYLPGVLVAAVVFYASCYAQRFHYVKGCTIERLGKQSIKEWLFIPLGAILLGMLPGLGIIPMLLALLGFSFLGKAASTLKSQTIKTTYSDGSVKTSSGLDGGSLASAGMILIGLAVALFAIWLASSVVIGVFHVAFLYLLVRNHLFRKLW